MKTHQYVVAFSTNNAEQPIKSVSYALETQTSQPTSPYDNSTITVICMDTDLVSQECESITY